MQQPLQQVGEQRAAAPALETAPELQQEFEAAPQHTPEAVETAAGLDGDPAETRMPHVSWSEDASMPAQQRSALNYHNHAQAYLDSINQGRESQSESEAPQLQTPEPSPEQSSLRSDAEAALQQEEAERAVEIEQDKERDYEFEP